MQRDGVALEPVSYPHLYKYSIDHPEKFWGERAKKFLVWDEPFTRVMEDDRTGWFTGGKLNVTREFWPISYINITRLGLL